VPSAFLQVSIKLGTLPDHTKWKDFRFVPIVHDEGTRFNQAHENYNAPVIAMVYLISTGDKHDWHSLDTSFPSALRMTTPSTTGDFRASAWAYSGPTVYTCRQQTTSSTTLVEHMN